MSVATADTTPTIVTNIAGVAADPLAGPDHGLTVVPDPAADQGPEVAATPAADLAAPLAARAGAAAGPLLSADIPDLALTLHPGGENPPKQPTTATTDDDNDEMSQFTLSPTLLHSLGREQ
eukprot:GHVL01033121.1.p2 GENE.GHVL01033121.1~~GHVL01033121.1.p2  ORF type:complete len:121 (+),score=19.13 GHVL01033121.1:247-609(+)